MAIPWTKIKADWLKGGTSYKKLGEKYGVSPSVIGNRASKEAWGKEKLKISEKVSNELGARIARTRVNHLEKLIAANEALLDGLLKTAEQIQKNPFQMLTDATGTLRNAESFAKAIETATRTQRDLYRLPNIDQKLAAKKFSADQKARKDAEKTVSGTVVRIVTDEGVELDG